LPQLLWSQEDNVLLILVSNFLQIGRSGSELRISNFRNGEATIKPKEHIAQSNFCIRDIVSLYACKSFDCSAGNYANLLMSKEILTFQPIGILFLKTCHNVIEKQYQLQLIAEDSNASLGDMVFIEGILHRHLTTLGLVSIDFLFLNF
jgi:hypothetical protein